MLLLLPPQRTPDYGRLLLPVKRRSRSRDQN
jgi:hypothetical protein